MPKVAIEFCSKCKWHNRAVWYLQEVMQTFEGQVTEIALLPRADAPGLFRVSIHIDGAGTKTVYQRRYKKTDAPQDEPFFYDGFPDSKFLKRLIRDELFPDKALGHVEHGAEMLCDCEPEEG